MKSFSTGVFVIVLGFVLLAMDAIVGVHVFYCGFLLAAAIFFSRDRLVYLYVIGGLIQDVRFQFPLGLTYLCIALFLVAFPFLLKILHSRMVVLGSYLSSMAILFQLVDVGMRIQPSDIFRILLFTFASVLVTYLLSLQLIRQQSVHIRTSLLRF